jgi:hypothetical protein
MVVSVNRTADQNTQDFSSFLFQSIKVSIQNKDLPKGATPPKSQSAQQNQDQILKETGEKAQYIDGSNINPADKKRFCDLLLIQSRMEASQQASENNTDYGAVLTAIGFVKDKAPTAMITTDSNGEKAKIDTRKFIDVIINKYS